MTLRIGRTTLLVQDVDEAISFYVEKLGFSVLTDSSIRTSAWAVHVGPGTAVDPGLWLIPTTSEFIGDQADGAPLLTLFTDDLDAEFARLKDNGVRITMSAERPGATAPREAHLLDLYENQIVLVEVPQ